MSKWYAEVTVGLIVEADSRREAEEKAADEAGGTELIEIGDIAPLGAAVRTSDNAQATVAREDFEAAANDAGWDG